VWAVKFFEVLRWVVGDPLAERDSLPVSALVEEMGHFEEPAEVMQAWVLTANELGLPPEKMRAADRLEWLNKSYWWKRSVCRGLDDMEYVVNAYQDIDVPDLVDTFGDLVLVALRIPKDQSGRMVWDVVR
jgi:hypothetical protein